MKQALNGRKRIRHRKEQRSDLNQMCTPEEYPRSKLTNCPEQEDKKNELVTND